MKPIAYRLLGRNSADSGGEVARGLAIPVTTVAAVTATATTTAAKLAATTTTAAVVSATTTAVLPEATRAVLRRLTCLEVGAVHPERAELVI